MRKLFTDFDGHLIDLSQIVCVSPVEKYGSEYRFSVTFIGGGEAWFTRGSNFGDMEERMFKAEILRSSLISKIIKQANDN